MSDTQVFYLHGFGSTAESDTVKKLRKDFPDAIGLDYDHNDPRLSILSLIVQINSSDKYPIIVGSSLGGWYAEQLTNHIVADFVLYNPSMEPEVTLARHGLSPDVLAKYERMRIRRGISHNSRSVLLAIDDEIIDYRVAFDKYRNNSRVMLTDGGHRMTETNMQLIIDRIKYLQNQLP